MNRRALFRALAGLPLVGAYMARLPAVQPFTTQVQSYYYPDGISMSITNAHDYPIIITRLDDTVCEYEIEAGETIEIPHEST